MIRKNTNGDISYEEYDIILIIQINYHPTNYVLLMMNLNNL